MLSTEERATVLTAVVRVVNLRTRCIVVEHRGLSLVEAGKVAWAEAVKRSEAFGDREACQEMVFPFVLQAGDEYDAFEVEIRDSGRWVGEILCEDGSSTPTANVPYVQTRF